MTDALTSPSPAPMEGGGVYSSSRVQAAGLSPAVPLLGRAASVVSLSNAPEAIVIADYGSSEGRNSLAPMAIAIGALRERVGPNRAISVIHTDLPGNDFSALFETLANDPDSSRRSGRIRFRGGAFALSADFAVRQRCTRMDLVDLALVELDASTNP